MAITPQPPRSRDICSRCSRPANVCLCDCLPETPLRCSADVVVIQHPDEAKKGIRTSQLLPGVLASIEIYGGRTLDEHPDAHKLLSGGHAHLCPVLLYPADDAIPLDRPGGLAQLNALRGDRRLVLVAIDGTWRKAKAMCTACKTLVGSLPKVALTADGCDEERLYHALRTEPREGMLSTLESIGRALRLIEGGDGGKAIEAALTRPLRRFIEQQHAFQTSHAHDLSRSLTRCHEVDPSLTRERVLRSFESAAAEKKANERRGAPATQRLGEGQRSDDAEPDEGTTVLPCASVGALHLK